MSLAGTGDALGDLIRSTIDALSTADKANRTKVFHAIGEAIIAHIIANGSNAISVTVASVSGVTVGAGTSGPGVGTGTIT